jgi:hypothetical protein
MNARNYSVEVDKRGGVDVVMAALQCSRDKVMRRVRGQVPVTRTDELAIAALPVVEHWLITARLKRDPKFRRKFRKRWERVRKTNEPQTDGTPTAMLKLLDDTLQVFKGVRGGSQKAANRKENQNA